MTESPFLSIDPSHWVAENALAFAIRDKHPVTPGHTLVIPRRVVPTWFEASVEEQRAIFDLVDAVKTQLDQELSPDGYNVGFNAGEAAGQTVMHLHVHVIPRHRGDMEDPRGGVRHVIPAKGNYLREASAESHPAELMAGEATPLGPRLLADLDRAVRADLAVAFVLRSGLHHGVLSRLREILRRPDARVRVLTGDYQDVTDPVALRDLLQLQEEARAFEEFGPMEVRVFETRRAGRSFHPKAYLLYEDGEGRPLAAYVGSSNLSKTALFDGVEWNLRVDGGTQRAARLLDGFETLFSHPCTTELSHEWIRRYEYRRKPPIAGSAPMLLEEAPELEAPEDPPRPHEIQAEALAALAETRAARNQAGLVVLATGLGKTWLAAFDSTKDRGFARVLFVAHRDEILRQAADTFARVRPDEDRGFYTGELKDTEADLVFASVQTLGRPKHLEAFARDAFDYVVIDEFHHASAPTYRRVIEYFEPRFLLGLTATPERSDGGDLLALCQQNLVYECALGRGIRDGHLCAFRYFGIADLADYPQIPWRSLDEQTLTTAVATQARAQNALEQWRAYAGTRTVGFCVSKRHADFMRDYFREHGVRAASVHSGAGSDPRTSSLELLAQGGIDVLFCVDMFNEGVDVPSIDTVLMLRPTESKTVWLQQLGRGLRRSEGKEKLTVIDYIGNHKVFIYKPEALLQALGVAVTTRRDVVAALRGERYRDALPPGCEVTYELGAVDLLEKLFPTSRSVERILQWYEDFCDYNGRRPTAVEAYQSDFEPSTLRSTYGSWFDFVKQREGLDADEFAVLERDSALLRLLETTTLNRSYKLLVLKAMLERGAMPGTLIMSDLVGAVRAIAERSARLRADVAAALDDDHQLETTLRKYPCKLLADDSTASSQSLFQLALDGFGTTSAVRSSAGTPLPAMVEELVEWRLAEYLDRSREGVRFRVIRNASGNPIVKIDRKLADLPEGWATVKMRGRPYRLNFAKEYVNVARDGEHDANVLPVLLRDWFGQDAGEPGGRFAVRHARAEDGSLHWEPDLRGASGVDESGSGTQVTDDHGTPLDARFVVDDHDGEQTLVFMSRGDGRNDQYNQGLDLLLRRLAARGVSLRKVAVDSGGTKQIAAEGRVLALSGYDYPIRLAEIADVAELRKVIGRAAAALGRKPGAKGAGNPTKRLRIWFELPAGVEVSTEALAVG